MDGLLKAMGLNSQQLQEIHALEAACKQVEPLTMKLNWDMLNKRPDQEINDLLYYREGKLVGFLGLYAIEPTAREIEITGMVHPDWRRQGIFRTLFELALVECQARNFARILLIAERDSPAGTNFAQSTGAQYTVSEFRMKFAGTTVPELPQHRVTMRQAVVADYPVLQQLDAVSFGSVMEELPTGTLQAYYGASFVGEADGKIIGKIGIEKEDQVGYIFGFGIRLEYRRQGLGRELLHLALRRCLAEQIHPVMLEVAVENERALSLYTSCGFETVTVYQYYELIL